jgi:hypothetical protein
VPRLSTLIGTAPDAARYSSARFMFGGLQNRGCRPAREAGLSLPPRTTAALGWSPLRGAVRINSRLAIASAMPRKVGMG